MLEEGEWEGVQRMRYEGLVLLGRGGEEGQDQVGDQETVAAPGRWEEPLLLQLVVAHEEAATVLQPPVSTAPAGWGLWAAPGWADCFLPLHSPWLTGWLLWHLTQTLPGQDSCLLPSGHGGSDSSEPCGHGMF